MSKSQMQTLSRLLASRTGVAPRRAAGYTARVARALAPKPRRPVTFTVARAAFGKPTMTQRDKWQKRPCVLEYRSWCDALREACPDRPDAGDVTEMEILARYAMPAYWSEAKRRQMFGMPKRSKPDGDNIAKGVCDALWSNDHQLGDIIVRRRWWDRDETIVRIEVCSE